MLFHSSGRLREQLLTSALNCKAKVPTSFHNVDRNKSRCSLREWFRKESIDYIIITFFNFDVTIFLIACKDLIRRFLTFNREQRITLDEALNHEWLRKGFDGPVKPVVFPNYPREEEMDKNILRHMTEKMDFHQKEVIDAVTLNRYIRGLIFCRNSARVSLEFNICTRYYRQLLTGCTRQRPITL